MLLALAFFLLPTAAAAQWTGEDSVFQKPSPRTLQQRVRAEAPRHLPTIDQVILDATYVNDDLRIKMQYPSTWERIDEQEEAPPLTLEVMFLSQTLSPGALRQNINLVVEELPSPLTLAEYTELGISLEKELIDDYELLESIRVPYAGLLGAQQVTFTGSFDETSMIFRQVWTVRDRLAFVWTFADSSETFEKNVATFERMLDSMTLY